MKLPQYKQCPNLTHDKAVLSYCPPKPSQQHVAHKHANQNIGQPLQNTAHQTICLILDTLISQDVCLIFVLLYGSLVDFPALFAVFSVTSWKRLKTFSLEHTHTHTQLRESGKLQW